MEGFEAEGDGWEGCGVREGGFAVRDKCCMQSCVEFDSKGGLGDGGC